MPENRTIAYCVMLSFLVHMMALMMASLVPWTARKAESVMVVDLADMPRSTDFFPPKPGVVEGGLPVPEVSERPRTGKPMTPRAMTGRVPDLPVNPALPPEDSFKPVQSPDQPKDAPAVASKSVPTPPQASPSSAPTAPGSAVKGDPSSGSHEGPSPPGKSGGSGRPLKDLNPSLGKTVLAMGETSGRGAGNSSGNAISTGGKAGTKGGIVEEAGGGTKFTALNAPEIQYISYFAGIKRKIELVWSYPAGAAGTEGDVIADFVVGRNGKLVSVTLVRGSGSRILDDEAIGAIRKAAPYAPIPSEYKIANLQIRAHFYYTVTQTRILR